MSSISKAIADLRPGEPWEMRGEDPKTLVWKGAGSPPTEAEIRAKAADIATRPKTPPPGLADTPSGVNTVAGLRAEINALKAHLRGER